MPDDATAPADNDNDDNSSPIDAHVPSLFCAVLYCVMCVSMQCDVMQCSGREDSVCARERGAGPDGSAGLQGQDHHGETHVQREVSED